MATLITTMTREGIEVTMTRKQLQTLQVLRQTLTEALVLEPNDIYVSLCEKSGTKLKLEFNDKFKYLIADDGGLMSLQVNTEL